MRFGKKLITLLLSLLFIFTIISITQAKSVYVISDTGTQTYDIPIIQAYRIQDSNLVYQADYNCVHPLAVGLGTSTEFYTYVPKELEGYPSAHELFIVFAYEPNSTVTVQEDVSNGNYVDVATFTLDKGQLGQKLFPVVTDKVWVVVWAWV